MIYFGLISILRGGECLVLPLPLLLPDLPVIPFNIFVPWYPFDVDVADWYCFVESVHYVQDILDNILSRLSLG